MGTFILKRKNYNLPSNEIKGENVGESIGRGTGAVIGTGVGGAIGATTGLVGGAAIGARNAVRKAAGTSSKLGAALKGGGKAGLIGAGLGLAAGAVLGHNKGKSSGGQLGVNVGGAIGSGIDSATQSKRYSVSTGTKVIFKAAKSVTPKSKRMKLARTAVKADQGVKNTAFELATNPGAVSGKIVKKISENPVTVVTPGGTSIGGTISTIIRKKPSTIDDVLRDTKVGRPFYKVMRSVGNGVARVSEPVVNSAYQMARSM